jgi:hypothetical protein
MAGGEAMVGKANFRQRLSSGGRIIVLTLLAGAITMNSTPTRARLADDKIAPHLTEAEILSRIKAAHILGNLAPGALSSYSLRVCVIPKQSGPAGDCLKGRFGVASSSTAFLSVQAGELTHYQVIAGDSGWQMVARSKPSGDAAPPKPVQLNSLKSRALREQARHSLPSLLARLGDQVGEGSISVAAGTESQPVVLTWVDGEATNKFFFNPVSLLCERQERKSPAGVTVMKYADHRLVDGVILPHRIEVGPAEDRIVATQVIEG